MACRVIPAARVELPLERLPASQVQAGSPRAGVARVPGVTGLAAGVWEHTAGVSTDVEVDEVFVVLSGSATVSFDDGESVELGPGSVVRLRAGDHTTWVVHETLRKIYVA